MDISEAMGRHIPLGTLLGIQLVEKGEGTAVLSMQVRPELMNSFGVAHGGSLMSLMDIAMMVAARTRDPRSIGALTAEMKSTFIAGATGNVRCEAECLKVGKSVSFCECRLYSEDGTLCATASGTFLLRHPK